MGVMGFAGTELWDYLMGFATHLAAAFGDYLSIELLDMLHEFAKMRLSLLRVVGRCRLTLGDAWFPCLKLNCDESSFKPCFQLQPARAPLL